MSVFEIVDTNDECMYFTMAFYSTFETAKTELLERANGSSALTDSGFDNDFEEIEIRKHALGWGKGHKTVIRLTRSKEYCEETDVYDWVNTYKQFDV